jgi:hypothetical protein
MLCGKINSEKIKAAKTTNVIAADGIRKYCLKFGQLLTDRDEYSGGLLIYILLIYLRSSYMKKSSFFFALIAVFAMMLFTQTELYSQSVNCPPSVACAPVPGLTMTGTQTICSHDPLTDTYCCVAVDYTMKVYNCPLPPAMYRFSIDKVEVLGTCNGGQSEVTENAIKAIMAVSVGLNLPNTSVSIPDCIEQTSTVPEIWEPCGSGCCIANYLAGWDSISGDYKLNSITLDSSMALRCPGGPCNPNCTIDNLPDVGRLHISDRLPDACLSSCIPDATIPYSWAYINTGGVKLSGLYSVGKEMDNTPCFSFHYFWDLSGSNTPESTVEALVKKALKDMWLNGNPQYISLNLPKCISQPYPGRKMYVNCYFEVECCRIKFEIIDNGNKAKVVSITPAGGTCDEPCTEICSIFTLDTEYGIPKLAVPGELEEINQSLKIIPNPTTGIFSLEYNVMEAGTHQIRVVDLLGVEVFKLNTNASKGQNYIKLDLTKIPLGTYYLQLLHNEQMISNAKFIRN